MSNERELFEQYIKKEYPFLNLARSTTNADEYSSATVCGFLEFWKAGIATMQDVRKDAERLDFIESKFTGLSDSERYLPFRIYWGGGNNKTLRQAIDQAIDKARE